MKKTASLILIGLLFVTAFSGCSLFNSDDKISIVTTLFPQYDFVKQIAQDKVNLTMILPAGTESHKYDPTPKDIITISNADMFIYTGHDMEPWAVELLNSSTNTEQLVIDLSDGVSLLERQHEDQAIHEFIQEHDHGFDPHIWLDMKKSQSMVTKIAEALSEIDPENAEFYMTNAEDYKGKISDLNNAFTEVSMNSERSVMVFGGRFACAYFVTRYMLDFEAAFSSCSAEGEASVQEIARLTDYIKDNNVPYIFYEELVDPKVAQSIADETGAELLLFNTCHNISKSDFENGVTFVDIMNQNLENLKVGLGYVNPES